MSLRLLAATLSSAGTFVICSHVALAQDWRDRLRDRKDDSPAVTRPAGLNETVMTKTRAAAYASAVRVGVTDRVTDPGNPVPYVRAEQTAVIEARHGDCEATGSLAHKAGDNSVVAATAAYDLNDDNGLRTHEWSGTLNARTQMGAVVPYVTGTAGFKLYDDFFLPDGPLDLSDNDRWRFGAETGVAFPVDEHLAFTVAAGGSFQTYDNGIDAAGFARGSQSGYLRTAATFAVGKVSGSVGVLGYRREYDEQVFDTTTALLGEANVTWRPNGKTALTFQYIGDVDETVIYGARDQFSDIAVLSLVRALGRKTTATAALYREQAALLGAGRTTVTDGAALQVVRTLAHNRSVDVSLEREWLTSTLLPETIESWKASVAYRYAFTE